MEKTNKNKIIILIPSILLEKELSDHVKKFGNLKEKFLKLNNKNSTIVFDLSKIKKIDFFGYQYLFSFYRYLKFELNIKTNICDKSDEFINFENKMGLNLEYSNE
jgi:hypothetical protein